ncbi:MAG: endolytic transglycosylase MltG [Candidatus Magasanikbacteria bacterium]|nr:endolytic transglycosylase MltG [Candidatus Magasanikbacteria bacterium]
MRKYFLLLSVFCILSFVWFVYSEIYISQAQKGVEKVVFEVMDGEWAAVLAYRLEEEGVIRNAWLFKKYLSIKGLDKTIGIGKFEVMAPITLARVAEALGKPDVNVKMMTIIPGWNLRQVAEYLVSAGFATNTEAVYLVTGKPAVLYQKCPVYTHNDGGKSTLCFGNEPIILSNDIEARPPQVSFEGYLSPDTYQVYSNASVFDILVKLMVKRNDELMNFYPQPLQRSGRTVHEILTMASILEREVKTEKDKRLVADIFWRRYDKNWALQADSTVHYALNKTGEVFTTQEERGSISPWNTYKYPGLPPSPICNPSLESIKAALYPEKNDYWYFLTGKDGAVHYAKTLEEHNENKVNYLSD